MRLRRLSRRLSLAAAGGTLLICVLGAIAWLVITDTLADIEAMTAVQQRTMDLRGQIGVRRSMLPPLADEAAIPARAEAITAELSRFPASGWSEVQAQMERVVTLLHAANDPHEPSVGAAEIRHLDARRWQEIAAQHFHLEAMLGAMVAAETDRLLNLLFLIIGAMAVITLGFVIACGLGFRLVDRRLDQPSRQIQSGLRALGTGDTSARIRVESRDELGEIAVAINALAERLEERTRASRRSERRLLEIARVAIGAIWELDLQAGTVWWMDSGSGLIDATDTGNEVTLDTLLARAMPEDRTRLRASIETSTGRDGVPFRIEHRWLRPDGTVVRVESRGVAVIDADSGRTLVIGGMQDISAQRELQVQLVRAQRLESIGQLTGGVSHDFNNLLTVIIGNAEMLEDALEDRDDDRQLVAMIRRAAERGADLNAQLLAFARRQPLAPRSVDVNELIERISPLLVRTLGEHIELGVDLAPDLWLSMLDPTQLESAIVNLAINARDAIGAHGQLQIETRNVILDRDYTEPLGDVMPGAYVQVVVADTGPGIAPEIIDHVFEPFFTTKADGLGSGLGLSMVYGFVKQSGGTVGIFSEPGLGATVKLYLPRATDDDQPPLPLAQTDGEPIGGTETVLLVEDDELVRDNGIAVLQGLGYRVLSAANGPRALQMLADHPAIDVLFTDVVMPGGMTGRELADAALVRRPQLAVLYTSGYSEHAIIHQGRLDPGIRFLQKPWARAQLARAIRDAIDSIAK